MTDNENKTDSEGETDVVGTFTYYFNRYKWVIPFIIVVALVAMTLSSVGDSYNMIVQKDVKVEQMHGNVQTALERRADLIPNYVEVVIGSATFEHDTLTDVIAMRAQANQIRENVKSARTVEEIQQNQDQLGAVIGRLMFLTEQYPVLQSTAQFKELEAQLTATENQINSERNTYNTAVFDYKQTVRTFPTNVVATIFGFKEDKWGMFKANEKAQDAPVVNMYDKLQNLSTSR
jgi:LemA protein